MFSGGSAAPAEAQQYSANTQPQTQQSEGGNCAFAAKQFTNCMDEHQGNMTICNWYLEQLVCPFDGHSMAHGSARRLSRVTWLLTKDLYSPQKSCQAMSKEYTS